jgi:hypothetical protein
VAAIRPSPKVPDHPPCLEDTPWAGMPLGAGIDHVSMCLRHGPAGSRPISLIQELAHRHGLVLYDPQGDDVDLPTDRDDLAGLPSFG